MSHKSMLLIDNIYPRLIIPVIVQFEVTLHSDFFPTTANSYAMMTKY